MRRLSLLFVALLLIAPIALEFSLQAQGYGRRAVSAKSERYGWRFLPDQQAFSLLDPTVPEHINDHGFRDRDWGPARPDPGVLRVIVFGNSLTFGTGVPVEQAWPRHLEAELGRELERRADARRAEVMSFAAPAYTVEQSVRIWEDLARPWQPDLVVFAIHPLDARPMQPTQTERSWPLRSIFVRTAIWDYLRSGIIEPDEGDDVALDAWRREMARMQADPFAEENRPHWMRAAARLARLRAEVESDGGHFVLVAIPLKSNWMPPHWPSLGQYLTEWVGYQRQAHPDTTVLLIDPLEEFLEAQAPLTQVIEERGFVPNDRHRSMIDHSYPHHEKSLYLLQDFGHYSAAGHSELARIVAREIIAAGLVP